MKQHFRLLLLIFTIGLIQKVNSQTESSWLENYEITQLPSLEKDILVLNIKNSGKNKKDCLRKAKEQALFHLLFKGISTNEILTGSNILPRKPIPFLEKFDQNDEKNVLYRFIRKTGFENIVDAENDETIEPIINEDNSKTFTSIIKLNTRSLIQQLEDSDLKRTNIEELGFKPKVLFLPSDLEKIKSILEGPDNGDLKNEYFQQIDLLKSSIGKSVDLLSVVNFKEKFLTEFNLNNEKPDYLKESSLQIISRISYANSLLQLSDFSSSVSLKACTDINSLIFSQISIASSKVAESKLDQLNNILDSDSEKICDELYFQLIEQKDKFKNLSVFLNCNSRLKIGVDDKINHAVNSISFYEVIQKYLSTKGIKYNANSTKNGVKEIQVSLKTFEDTYISQDSLFVDDLSKLIAEQTGNTIDIDFIGNKIVHLELTDIKRLDRKRKIEQDYKQAISQNTLELYRDFLNNYFDSEYVTEIERKFNELIVSKVNNKLSTEEYSNFLKDKYCTTSRGAVIDGFIESLILNWNLIASIDELKALIQTTKLACKNNVIDFDKTEKYGVLINRYNELITEKIKAKLSREEYSVLLKDDFCTSSRKAVETSFVESLIPVSWREINTLKGINELIRDIESACEVNNLTTTLTTDYHYSVSDFSEAGKWTFENLRTSHFANGDTIYEAKSNEDWIRANNEKRPAWCYFNNDEGNKWNGKLYNYYAVNDPRGLVQNGYSIPSFDDYLKLFNQMGGKFIAGRRMKAILLWGEDMREDEQFMGFTAKPSGYRNEKGDFLYNSGNGEINYTGFWTSTQNGENASVICLEQNSDEVKVNSFSDRGNGWSVRVLQKSNLNKKSLLILPIIAEIQLKRDRLILKEFQNQKYDYDFSQFFYSQFKEELNMSKIHFDELDPINIYNVYNRVMNNPNSIKNGIFPSFTPYIPEPDQGAMGEGGDPYGLIKVGYTNNIEDYNEFIDGSIYRGPIVEGSFKGEGFLVLGEDAQSWGFGKLELSKGDRFQGDFDGMEFTNGKITFKNGNVYVGECKSFQPHGEGKLTLANGQVQQGKFVEGEFIKPFSCKESKIGNQTWMAENLKVTKFRNGEEIMQAQSEYDWLRAAENLQPAWCYYFDESNVDSYGILYNWFAVNDPRGLAPEGWHVPSIYEWQQMINYIEPNSGGGEDLMNTVGLKLKSPIKWKKGTFINVGQNKYGFNVLPGGMRTAFLTANDYSSQNNSRFMEMNEKAYFWSSTPNGRHSGGLDNSYVIDFSTSDFISVGDEFIEYGLSVRCVKD
jgi:uncharacterized protein (TIGR02145 family)